MSDYIRNMEQQIESLRAKEYDSQVVHSKKSQETDMQVLSLKSKLEDQARDKKLIEDDLYASRDKLKEILKEKLTLQNELHEIERLSDQRISELEYQLHTLNTEFQQASEENGKLREKVSDREIEVQQLEKSRDTFKQQFMELREINKELK